MTEETAMSKDELLANIESGWNDLHAYLATLSYEQVTIPSDPAGWTAKDHLAHLAVWEDSINALFDQVPRWEQMGVDRDLFESADWDRVNAVIQQRTHAIPLSKLQAMWFGIHERLIGKISALSDADLQRPYREFQPGAAWDLPVIHWAIIDTYPHYDEHKGYIDVIVRQRPVSVAKLLDAIQTGWEAFYAYLDTLSEAQLTQLTDAAGWTVKDHVAHVAVWENAMIALLEQRPVAAALGIDPALLGADAIDASNAILKARDQALSWPEVRQKHEQIHQRLIAHIQALTDADLLRPYTDYAPESHEQASVLAHLVSNTLEHYDEHRPWIEAIVSGAPKPMTTAQLLAAIDARWDDLNQYLDTLSEAQLTQRTDAAGWTVKDHVIHMAVWEGDLLVLFDGGNRRETLGIVDEDAWDSGDWDRLNAVFQKRYHDLSWAEVQQRRQQIHQQVIAKLQTLSDADIYRPYRYFQPDSTVERPVMGWISGATFQHYAEHLPWIEAIVTRQN